MKDQEEPLYYLEGLHVPETPDPGDEPKPWKDTHTIGEPKPRVDAYQRVSGAAIYPSDVKLPNMLYGVVIGCPHPNALVKKVDMSEAEQMPGVRAAISGQDSRNNPSWKYGGKGKTKIFDPHCRYEGDAVAAIAADTPYQAWDAAKAVKVEYEVLPFVADYTQALSAEAPKVHSGGNRVGEAETYERGDVKKGFEEADVVLEQEYRSQCQIHTPLELHGCVAQWDGDALTVWESTQGVYGIQSSVAEALEMPLAKVRVIGHYMGGGFGSKLEPGKYTICAALLAKIAARPVKLFLSREQTYLVTGNRPPEKMKLKAGVKKDGTLTALDFSCLGTGGAYPAGGVQLVDFLIKDNYLCPNVRTRCTDVYINAGPARPFRAPGHPQGSWALEQMLDALAEAIDMDPLDLRLKNIPTYSQGRPGNKPYTTTGLKECLEMGAEAFGWKEKRKQRAEKKEEGRFKTGIGMAGTEWVVGGGWPPSTVVLKLFSDGSANLNMGASDIGTGTKTVMALIVSEELGLKSDHIQIENADTGTTQYATPSGGSKTVPTEGPAVREAAVRVKQKVLEYAAEDLNEEPVNLRISGGSVVSRNDPSKKVGIRDIKKLQKQGVLVGIGYKAPNPEDKWINPFGAQYCEVKVDTKTGEVEVTRFVASHDSGRVMDALTYESQVIGGITMGIGFGMTEMRILDKNQTGKLCNKNWHDYKLPTALDACRDITSIPLDSPDNEANSTGAKGLGEPVTIPTAAAIANAVYDAVGVRVTETPINLLRLSALLAERRGEDNS